MLQAVVMVVVISTDIVYGGRLGGGFGSSGGFGGGYSGAPSTSYGSPGFGGGYSGGYDGGQVQYETKILEQRLYFWTLSIFWSLSKNTVLFIFQNIAFRRLDSVSFFM
jgi:hypothetical protein